MSYIDFFKRAKKRNANHQITLIEKINDQSIQPQRLPESTP